MSASDYWYSRLIFERSLALVYLVAFLCAANQFIPLLGEHGLLPVPRFVRKVMTRRPGRLLQDINIDMPRPRDPAIGETPYFNKLCGELRRLISLAHG